MQKFPDLSIIIVSLNSQRTLSNCLQYIKHQTYPKIKEILLIDGGSTDNTLKIAKTAKLPIKIIYGGYKNNQEARRAIGIIKAKSEICAMIDTDNYIIDKDWLKDMVEPLLNDQTIVASQTLRYDVPKKTSALNRYFGLLGAADPVAYYLRKADRLSWAFNRWNLLGRVLLKKRGYFIIVFDPNNFPTLGANGIVFRRSKLLKSNWGKPENFFHTDVFVDIAKQGLNKFAIVNNKIFHNTADNITTFLLKRKKYMELHYQELNSSRRYSVLNLKKREDIIRLIFYILFSLTLIEPMYESVRGYLKKKDFAWFLHPAVCLGISLIYAQASIFYLFKSGINHFIITRRVATK